MLDIVFPIVFWCSDSQVKSTAYIEPQYYRGPILLNLFSNDFRALSYKVPPHRETILN